jgi:hypothetical protein
MLTAPPGSSRGIPGPNTAARASPVGLTRSLGAWVSHPLHRRRFPQALRYVDNLAQAFYVRQAERRRRFLPMAKARGLRAED